MMPVKSFFRKSARLGSSATPLARYQQRVADGELRADRAQFAAVRRLNRLHRELLPGRRRDWRAHINVPWRRGGAAQDRGIYLWGGVGAGKTLLMDLFHHSLPAELTKREHYHRFMQSVHDAKGRIHGRQDPLAEVAAQLTAGRRVLCLDEFSVTDITDAMILSALLHALFANGASLVTTSNSHPDELYRDGLQRQRFLPAIELLKTRTRVIRVDGGNDYRMEYLAMEALYHVPHDADAERALRRSFLQLEDGETGGAGAAETMQLAGREVATVAVGQGTVWFSFDSLCNSNRSKLDYIELSKRFHTLILSDIPALDADTDDAARRFIELVDELYDRGVNLITSAARPPAELYGGMRLRQPFQRAASRLQEMGSREYLARPHLP